MLLETRISDTQLESLERLSTWLRIMDKVSVEDPGKPSEGQPVDIWRAEHFARTKHSPFCPTYLSAQLCSH